MAVWRNGQGAGAGLIVSAVLRFLSLTKQALRALAVRGPALFIFQADAAIRDHCVTGVQTCALPICRKHHRAAQQAPRTGPRAPRAPAPKRRLRAHRRPLERPELRARKGIATAAPGIEPAAGTDRKSVV